MATYFWGNSNANGTWNTFSNTNWWTDVGRTTPAATAPLFTDNVIFDVTSGNGNVAISAGVCNDFTVTATQALTIPTGTTLTIYGNLTFPTTGLFRTATSGGAVFSPTFASTVPGKTISTNGKQLGINTNFNGVGGGWTLGNSLVGSSGFLLSNGTLNTNSFRVESTIDLGVGTKTLTLGNSTVFFGGQGTVIEFETNKAGFTLNANTSTIVVTGSSSFAGGGFTFNNVQITTFGSNFNTISGQNTYQNLTFTTPSTIGDVGHVVVSNTQTINGTLTINSSGQANTRVCIRSANIGSQVAFSAPTVSLTDVDFRDINFSPPATGTRLGDCGGNNNITFLPAKTVYAVANAAGGFGNFDSNIWATSSGGTPAANNFPLAQDTIIFNNFGSNSNVTLRATYNLGTVDTSARTANTVSIVTTNSSPAGIFFYGNLICGPTTRWLGTGTGNLVFAKRSSEQIITSAGITFINPINIDSFSGNFRFNDNFISTNSTANPGLLIVSGSLSANTVNVTANSITTNYPRSFKSVSLGSGTWTITGTGTLFNTAAANLTWNSQTSNVIISNDSTTAKTLSTTGISLGNVFIGGTSGNSATYTISGNYARLGYTRTITSNLAFSTTGVTTIGVWSVSGTAAYPINIRSSSGGTRAQINVATRTSGIDYLNISDINIRNFGSGVNPYLFYAGDNSINGSLNANIAFISSSVESPQTVYLLSRETNNNGNPAGVWITPNDWDSNNNIIHMIGPGGGGNGFASVSGNLRSAAGGGGGGAYVRLTNFPSTPGSNISYYVWEGIGLGAGSANAQVTGWSSNTYIANGGQRGTTVAGISSTGGRGGAASAITGIITASFAGGDGGSGAFANAASTGHGSGGGGGAGGPFGKGGDGGRGVSSTVAANIAGGGGGGGGGGSNGGDASAGLSGAGGNNYLGTGGGAPSSSSANIGANGAGSSGATSSGVVYVSPGGRDMIADTLGSGGGAGGHGGTSGSVTSTQNYGGGGAGHSVTTAGVLRSGGDNGQPGAIFIIYSPSATVTTVNSNMFFLF